MRRFIFALQVVFLGACASSPALVLHQDFATPASLAMFQFSDEAAWCHGLAEAGSDPVPQDGNTSDSRAYLSLHSNSDYKPPHRSPRSLAIVKNLELTDFIVEFEVAQTGRDYAHRDLCFFFGYKDPGHYYYVHLATTPDPRAHNVFLVDGAARKPLCPVPSEGVDWGPSGTWHTVRLTRSAGHIQVYFDGLLTHEVVDTTLPSGRIGFGSFDDTGRLRELSVWR